jgi:hypothetical protein
MQEETVVVVYGEIHRSTFVMWSQNIHYVQSGDTTVVVSCCREGTSNCVTDVPFPSRRFDKTALAPSMSDLQMCSQQVGPV